MISRERRQVQRDGANSEDLILRVTARKCAPEERTRPISERNCFLPFDIIPAIDYGPIASAMDIGYFPGEDVIICFSLDVVRQNTEDFFESRAREYESPECVFCAEGVGDFSDQHGSPEMRIRASGDKLRGHSRWPPAGLSGFERGVHTAATLGPKIPLPPE